MRILVTGGAGFIGSHLVERLLAAGHRVRVLDDLSTGKYVNLLGVEKQVELIIGDIRDPMTVSHVMQDMEAVVHLAAVASVQASVDDPMGTHQTNFDGTLNLLEAARRQGVQRFLYASSAAVYGNTECLPVSEEHAPQPLTPYAVDKLAGEYYALYYFRQHRLPVTAFRFFNVYGPRQDPASPYSGVISIFVDRVQRREALTVFGDGAQTRDFVYVEDLAAVLAAAVTNAGLHGQVLNVGTGRQYSLLVLVQALERIAGRSVFCRHAPARPGDIRHSYAQNTRLKQLLGFVPDTPLEEGLRRLYAWTATAALTSASVQSLPRAQDNPLLAGAGMRNDGD